MKRVVLFCFLTVFLLGNAQVGLKAQDVFVQAADDASFYFAHGIDGTVIGEASSLSVDIYVNGKAILKGVKFGKVKGPKKVKPGATSVEVYRAGEGPGSGTPLIKFDNMFKPYENVSFAFYLDPDKTIVIQKFANDLSPLGNPDKCRIIVHNIGAGVLNIEFYNPGGPDGHPITYAELFEPGDKYSCEIAKKVLFGKNKGAALAWKLWVDEGDSDWVMLYHNNFTIKPGKAMLVFLMGSVAEGYFKVVKKAAKLK